MPRGKIHRSLGIERFAATAAEYLGVQAAITLMMADIHLTTIPNVVSANTAPCTTGTQDMTAFPDSSTTAANKVPFIGGMAGAGDLVGFILFGHDIVMDNAATGLVNSWRPDRPRCSNGAEGYLAQKPFTRVD